MVVRNIEKEDSVFLHRESRPVEWPLSESVRQVIRDLNDTLNASEHATGLAAPQIGSNVNIIVYRLAYKSNTVMINPRIVKAADFEATPKFEMCLSYPGQIYALPRYKRISVYFEDLTGDSYVLKYRGFEATVIQHEIDHLLGITIADKGEKLDSKTTRLLLEKAEQEMEGDDHDEEEK